MVNAILAIMLAAMTAVSVPAEPAEQYTDAGTYRITQYCERCNSPAGSRVTASGRWEPGYSAASSDIPLGTVIRIDGYGERRIDDTGCPSGTIDLLIDTVDGECRCDVGPVPYKKVKVRER